MGGFGHNPGRPFNPKGEDMDLGLHPQEFSRCKETVPSLKSLQQGLQPLSPLLKRLKKLGRLNRGREDRWRLRGGGSFQSRQDFQGL